jgi:uncharacterized SAM-binding protein YcdF (DUF218 family)
MRLSSARGSWTPLNRRVAVAVVATGGLVWIAGVGWVVWRGAEVRRSVDAASECFETALVLGCTPGPGLERRVAGAVALWRAERVRRIVVSGRGEGAAGVEWARGLGVPDAALHAEVEARTTLENFARCAPLLAHAPFFIVTDDWHMPRALTLARLHGLDGRPHPVRAPWRSRLLAREGLSIVKTLAGATLRGRD